MRLKSRAISRKYQVTSQKCLLVAKRKRKAREGNTNQQHEQNKQRTRRNISWCTLCNAAKGRQYCKQYSYLSIDGCPRVRITPEHEHGDIDLRQELLRPGARLPREDAHEHIQRPIVLRRLVQDV